MRSVIQQSVLLPAPAERLFAMYLDPVEHAAFTGLPVTIGGEAGAKFEAFDGQLSGTILAVVQSTLIVQSWRSVKFNPDDLDSTLILSFTPNDGQPDQGRIDLVHTDVPQHDYQDVIEGWQKYYWTPWRACLERHA
jgi:activator of HSP90 ATPase